VRPGARRPPRLRRRGAGLRLALATLALLLLPAGAAGAHPLGNFTTNTSATVLPAEGRTRVLYVLDLAEIPAQQVQDDVEAAGSPERWAAEECARVADAQDLLVGGSPRALAPDAVAVAFPEGEAGLRTLRLTCELSAPTEGLPDPVEVTYADGYTSGRVGWREVVALGDGSTVLEADVPATSPTDRLRDYPEGEVQQVTTAALVVDPDSGPAAPGDLAGGESLTPVARGGGGLEGLVLAYTDFVGRQELTVPFVLLAALLAVLLGTAHAVAPGHGKTVIAAYLLGEGGQARAAAALGATVAVTHTVGVLLLGVLVQTTTAVAPERLYPILGVAGGVLFTGLGVVLLRRALTGRGHDHDHGHDHGHAPAGAARPVGWRLLVLPGLAGGLVPSPSALLVLLGGIALDRTWFGILLVVAYGVGMALALVGAGYLLHRVRGRLEDRLEGPTWVRVSGALPLVTSSLIVLGGLAIVGRSLLTA
jgi:nickel/cobalt transporter (NicO) family protein